MFVSNGYSIFLFFEKCFKKFNEKFLHSHSACSDHIYNLNIPYFVHDSRRFINKLQNIINFKLKLTVKINPVYINFKVSYRASQKKCNTFTLQLIFYFRLKLIVLLPIDRVH